MEIDTNSANMGNDEEMTEEEETNANTYAKELDIEFSESSQEFLPPPSPRPSGPVTIYRLIKLEHAEALGISLQEGSVSTPNQSTKIITRNIIKLKKPPKKMVLAQKNMRPTESAQYVDRHDDSYYEPYIIEDQDACNSMRKYVCKICNKGFRHVSHLKRHINSHIGDRQYQCDACDKRFVDASTLCRHRKTHTGERPFVCKICKKRFSTLGSLRRHITVHNQESRPYCCTICSKRFPDNSSFQKHRLIHTGIKRFQCNICLKAFVHIGDLNGHKKVHEKLKPWKCDRCDKEFSKQSNCMRHAQIHEGDKDFVCNICGVGYNFQSSLTRHLLTHRRKDTIKRNTNHKVVIFRKIDSQIKGQTKKVEPHKLTLNQIKSLLVRKRKLTITSDSNEVEISDVGNTSHDMSQQHEDADVEEINVEEGNEDEENEEHMENSLVEDSEERLDGEQEGTDTIIIKHITANGKFEYIIEEALD